MDTESYQFKLGDFECVSISDGSHNYPLQDFFANVPYTKKHRIKLNSLLYS